MGFSRKKRKKKISASEVGAITNSATRMVSNAKILALSSYEPLLDRCPELAWVDKEEKLADLIILMAIAGVGAAAFLSVDHLSEAEQKKVSQIIKQELQSYYPQGPALLYDLMEFLGKNLSKNIDPADSIGLWLLINLKGEWPTAEEAGPARPIGQFLLYSLNNWWK